jgi:hypothetical protein
MPKPLTYVRIKCYQELWDKILVKARTCDCGGAEYIVRVMAGVIGEPTLGVVPMPPRGRPKKKRPRAKGFARGKAKATGS